MYNNRCNSRQSGILFDKRLIYHLLEEVFHLGQTQALIVRTHTQVRVKSYVNKR